MDGRTARAVLGVAEHTDSDALRRAYRARLHAAHPDHGGSRDQLDSVRAAFAVLDAQLAQPAADRRRERATPRPDHRAATTAAPAVLARTGFCAYDAPTSWRRTPQRDFADVLAAAMVRVAAAA